MIDILVPAEQEGTKAIVRSWLKKIGDTVAENDPLVELETDRVTQEVPAPAGGILAEVFLDTDAEALPGGLLGRLRAPDPRESGPMETVQQPCTEAALPTARPAATKPPGQSMITVLSPAVRRALIHHGTDPADVAGTGRDGRITRNDVDAFVENRGAAPAQTPPPAPQIASGGVRVIPHDRMRLAIAANMLGSVTAAPHVAAVFEADFSAIMAHRRKHKEAFAKDGANLTFTAYFIAACVQAMGLHLRLTAAGSTIGSRYLTISV